MTLFAAMLTNALLMTLIIALYLLLRIPLQRRVKPIACYAIGIIVSIGLLIPLRPALPVPLLRTPAPIRQLAAPALNLPDTIPYDYDFTTAQHQERLLQAQITNEPAPLGSNAPTWVAINPWQVAGIVWLVGIVLLLAYHTIRHLRFRHLVRRWHDEPSSLQRHALTEACEALNIKRPPRLWQCRAVQSPMLIGLFQPIILLPHQPFSFDEMVIILQHELMHLKRNDLWYKALVLAVVCLHWWNPLVRRMARAISADCEMSCDDAVLLNADLMRRKLYGETILGAITRQNMPHAALSTYFYEGRNDMKRRFAGMLNVHPRSAGSLAIVACLCLTFFTGSVFAAEGVTTAANANRAVSPTTGMLYPAGRDNAYRPMLIEISNSADARPQLSISLADIVYEYIYWGPGHTRYLALYNDYHPELAGAVRSTKTLGMSLRNSWDCPIIFGGGPDDESIASVYRFIEDNEIPQSMLFDSTRPAEHSADIFFRITSREAPHNLVASLQALAAERWPTDGEGAPYEPAMPTLHFSSEHSRGEAPATEIIIPYDEQEYLARYTFSAAEGHYERWYNGTPQLDGITGQRLIASNVIILYAGFTYYENAMSQPLWDMTGEGRLDVFIGGRHIPGIWQRADDASAFEYYDENGATLLLAPGKTFIQVVPGDMQIHQSG